MRVSFHSRKIEDALNGEKDGSYSVLEKMLRKEQAHCKVEDIIQAYEVLKAVKNVGDIPRSYRFHGLSCNHNTEYAIRVDGKHRILFKVIDATVDSGRLLEAQEIEITRIGIEYHQRKK